MAEIQAIVLLGNKLKPNATAPVGAAADIEEMAASKADFKTPASTRIAAMPAASCAYFFVVSAATKPHEAEKAEPIQAKKGIYDSLMVLRYIEYRPIKVNIYRSHLKAGRILVSYIGQNVLKGSKVESKSV